MNEKESTVNLNLKQRRGAKKESSSISEFSSNSYSDDYSDAEF